MVSHFAFWIAFIGGFNQCFRPLAEKHFRPWPVVVTIERQHEGFFDDVAIVKRLPILGLDLRVSLTPTSDSIFANFASYRIPSLCGTRCSFRFRQR